MSSTTDPTPSQPSPDPPTFSFSFHTFLLCRSPVGKRKVISQSVSEVPRGTLVSMNWKSLEWGQSTPVKKPLPLDDLRKTSVVSVFDPHHVTGSCSIDSPRGFVATGWCSHWPSTYYLYSYQWGETVSNLSLQRGRCRNRDTSVDNKERFVSGERRRRWVVVEDYRSTEGVGT